MSSRRKFIKTASFVSLSPLVPAFLQPLASAGQGNPSGRKLIVIQLDGGNDGINTIVPFQDEGYAKYRTRLRLPQETLLRPSQHIAMHPELVGFSQLMEQQRLSVVLGVGYPNPSQSHFESMKIWQIGSDNHDLIQNGNGWIGDAMSNTITDAQKAHAISVGNESIPMALRGRRCLVTSMSSPDDLKLKWNREVNQGHGMSEQKSAPKRDRLLDFVKAASADAYLSSTRWSQELPKDASANYPGTQLSQRLKFISQMIKSDSEASVFYAIQPGYDTHAMQIPSHANLLAELSGAVKSFMDDMRQSALEDQVLVMCFSEFGRRVEENGSAGTDHGTSGPVFLVGNKLQQAAFGQQPSLMQLASGDLVHHVDFRNIYASIVADWLGLALPEALKGYRMDGLLKA